MTKNIKYIQNFKKFVIYRSNLFGLLWQQMRYAWPRPSKIPTVISLKIWKEINRITSLKPKGKKWQDPKVSVVIYSLLDRRCQINQQPTCLILWTRIRSESPKITKKHFHSYSLSGSNSETHRLLLNKTNKLKNLWVCPNCARTISTSASPGAF